MSDEERNAEKLTLEELLKLKQAERPSDSFWQKFDRDLEKKIVRSVVSREPRFYAMLGWFRGHLGLSTGFAAAVCVLLVGLSQIGEEKQRARVAADESSLQTMPRIAATFDKAKPINTLVAAPTLSSSQSDFVIEVLSSNSAVVASPSITFNSNGSSTGNGAYYVADQLSSADQGWSGERLPF